MILLHIMFWLVLASDIIVPILCKLEIIGWEFMVWVVGSGFMVIILGLALFTDL